MNLHGCRIIIKVLQKLIPLLVRRYL